MNSTINKTITINAPASTVWNTLTNPDLMKLWLWESETTILADWSVGNPIVIQGDFHGIAFETKGTVLQVVPEHILSYTYWSSLSQLPDEPENYSVIAFNLAADENQTIVTFTETHHATLAIYKHSEFYWNTTLELMKQLIEHQTNLSVPLRIEPK